MATRQEPESEFIKLPRLQLQVVYYDLTRSGQAKKNFLVKFWGILPFSNLLSQHLHNCERWQLETFSVECYLINFLILVFDRLTRAVAGGGVEINPHEVFRK